MHLAINSVSCIQASSGVSSGSADAFSGVVTVAMGALGAAAGVAAGAAATVGTAGIGIPLTVALPALAGASASAMGLIASQGVINATKAIGTSLADELYIKVNGNRVYPAQDPYVAIKSGQRLVSVSDGTSGQHHVAIFEGDKQVETISQGNIYSQDLSGSQATIELWEHDIISSDDLLGSYTVSLQTKVTSFPLVAANAEEESIYLVTVTVW